MEKTVSEEDFYATILHPYLKPGTLIQHTIGKANLFYKILEVTSENMLTTVSISLLVMARWKEVSWITNDSTKVYTSENTVNQIKLFNKIRKIVCKNVHIPVEMLISTTRKREIVIARFLVFYFARHYIKPNLSYDKLGELIRPDQPLDHASVLHGINTIKNLKDNKDNSESIKEKVALIEIDLLDLVNTNKKN